jgi:hypothetical protein
MYLTLTILLCAYSLGTTVALFLLYRRTLGNAVPWYERTISAMGVIAFFSMTVAAGVQTIKSAVEDLKLERAKSDVSALEREKESMQELIARLSRATLSQIQESGVVDRANRDLLHQRLETILTSSKPSKDEIPEAFEIALILRDYEAAKELSTQYKNLSSEASPGDKLAFAEFIYLGGAKNSAKDILSSLEPIAPTLPRPWQVRIIILRARIDGASDGYVEPLAGLLQISPQQAKTRLEREIVSDRNAVLEQNRP